MFVRSLTIDRYRGLEHLEWQPSGAINCLIGPGDVGKTTVLSAIELVLDPRSSPATSEYDYFRRRVENGFEITAVLGDLDQQALSAMRTPPLQGWLDGEIRPLPDEDGAEAVLVARVTGSPDLELNHVLIAPNGVNEVPFTVAHRRRLCLSRVASGTKAGMEFRLGRGSLLDRHAGGTALHASIRTVVADASTNLALPNQASEALARLRTIFGEAGLPADLSLSIITPQGWSLLTLVGLLEGGVPGEAVPLSLAGAGTRQLALFRLAAELMEGSPIVVLDEPEGGLEPYRQRKLIADIRAAIGDHGQAFLTTHSPAVLEALDFGEVSRLSPGGNPVFLGGTHIGRIQKEAPDSLLSRLPILCEGDTEAGLLAPVLNYFAHEAGLTDIDALGVRLVSRHGQPHVLAEAEQLLEAGLACGLFVDNEDSHGGKRAVLAAMPQCAFGTWVDVRNVEEAVAKWLPWDHLYQMLEVARDLRGCVTGDLLKQVGECIEKPGETTLQDLRAEFDELLVRKALASAMQSKRAPWFKSLSGGEALARYLLSVGLPPQIEDVLRAFWERIREESGWG